MSTVALFASARRHGNTGQFVDHIAEELCAPIIDLTEKSIGEFDYDHRNRRDDFERLIDHVLSFDQIIFASPVYWYAVCPPMKRFLDRFSDLLEIPELLEQGRRLRSKVCYVVCTSVYDDVPRPFIEAFEETFRFLGMRFGGFAHANCSAGYMPNEHYEAITAFVARVKEFELES